MLMAATAFEFMKKEKIENLSKDLSDLELYFSVYAVYRDTRHVHQ